MKAAPESEMVTAVEPAALTVTASDVAGLPVKPAVEVKVLLPVKPVSITMSLVSAELFVTFAARVPALAGLAANANAKTEALANRDNLTERII
jgi:hypothetical protein